MTYIYPITDPEILGIRMALYESKRPEIYDIPNAWQEHSFIAYLKEPEFTIESVLYDPDGVKILVMNEGNLKLAIAANRMPHCEPYWSHYYPGQEYDGDIKYVRKVVKSEMYIYPEAKVFEIEGTEQWQEVEEPEEQIPGCSAPPFNWMPNPDYTQFQADKKQAKILAEI